MRLVPPPPDIASAAKILARSNPHALKILEELIAKKPIQTAWNVLYRLDEKEVNDRKIVELYSECGSDLEEFVRTVKSRRFLECKLGEK